MGRTEWAAPDADFGVFRGTARRALDDALRGLRRGVLAPMSLLGPPAIGRSALIAELAVGHPGVDVVAVDLRPRAPVPATWFRELAYRALGLLAGDELPDAPARLALGPGSWRAALAGSPGVRRLPGDLRERLVALRSGPVGPDLVDLTFQLLERRARERRRPVLLAIDNVQELLPLVTQRGGVDFWPAFDRLRHGSSAVALLLAGRRERALVDALEARRDDPRWVHATLTPASPSLAREALGPHVGAERAARLVDVLGGHAHYLDRAVELHRRRGSQRDEALLGDLLWGNGGLRLHFELLKERTVRRSTFLGRTLRLLADGPTRVSEVARTLGVQTGAVVGYLERLDDLVERRPDGAYALADGALARWLVGRDVATDSVAVSLLGSAAERRVSAWLGAQGVRVTFAAGSGAGTLVAERGAGTLVAERGERRLLLLVHGGPLPLRLARRDVARLNRQVADDATLTAWAVAVAPNGATAGGASDVSSGDASGGDTSGGDASGVRLLDPAKARWGREVLIDLAAAASFDALADV